MWDDAVRALLDDPDPRLADPMSYHLWSGDLDDPDQVDRAWEAATQGIEDAPLRRVRLLEIAEPVPWRLKRDLQAGDGDDPRDTP